MMMMIGVPIALAASGEGESDPMNKPAVIAVMLW